VSDEHITLEELRGIDLFDELDDAELERWIPVAQVRDYGAGEVLAEYGEEPQGMILLLSGLAQALIKVGDRMEPGGYQRPPTWVGAIAVLMESQLGARMLGVEAGRLALIPAEDFRRLAREQPAIQRRVMQQIAPVMTRVTAIEQNRERLASLGTMAAGLAHELNNPAAAAQRASADLVQAVDVLNATMRRFVDAGISREDAERLLALHAEIVEGAEERTALDTLDAADAEDEVLAQLEDLGVPEAWRFAEPLAAAGVDRDWLGRLSAVAGPATPAAVEWVAATLTARGLAGELQESTRRISGLVGAVKSYAYMDRGELVEVDIHEGLETTLVVLGHRLKHTSIEIVRDYDRDLPKLIVNGSELNQVWTNLLDNAIDALGESGTITLRTRSDGDRARIDIANDGPEIPQELRERIFDAFFTTKDVGRGTGLGLATSRGIVVDRHGGAITVDSNPGETTFSVWLPFRRARDD
jgi:signal transduction histidine kinase